MIYERLACKYRLVSVSGGEHPFRKPNLLMHFWNMELLLSSLVFDAEHPNTDKAKTCSHDG